MTMDNRALDPLEIAANAACAAVRARDPETVINAVANVIFPVLGDRTAHLKPEALQPGQQQYFVAGGFLVTPDRKHQMLVGNIGFPPEQKRLLIPIDGGNPGQVIASGKPLLLEDTTLRADFRQYLKTSRMGSAIYAPLIWHERVIGLLIMAAQARWTMGAQDLAVLTAIAPAAAASWIANGGDAWLAAEHGRVRGDTTH